MAGRFLLLSFHLGHQASGRNIGEDLGFKKAAAGSRLAFKDAMDEKDARDFLIENEKALANDPGDPYSGLDRFKHPDDPKIEVVSLLRVGGNAWYRRGYRRTRTADPERPLPSLFEQWLRRVFATPVEILVLAGHHQSHTLWGAEDTRVKTHRWYTALKPVIRGASMLEVHQRRLNPPAGIVDPEDEPKLIGAGPFDLTATLRPCRLLIILGCNGATRKHGKLWSDWIENAAGVRPFVFGWYNVHKFPVDARKEFAMPGLWEGLQKLADENGVDDLSFLHDGSDATRDKVLQMWSDVTNKAFQSAAQRHLFFYKPVGGVGAIDTKGKLWRVQNKNGKFEQVTE